MIRVKNKIKWMAQKNGGNLAPFFVSILKQSSTNLKLKLWENQILNGQN